MADRPSVTDRVEQIRDRLERQFFKLETSHRIMVDIVDGPQPSDVAKSPDAIRPVHLDAILEDCVLLLDRMDMAQDKLGNYIVQRISSTNRAQPGEAIAPARSRY